MPWDIVFFNTLQKMKFLSTVRTPIVDRFPIEDPSLKIQIEDPFLFSKNWVLVSCIRKNSISRSPKSLARK